MKCWRSREAQECYPSFLMDDVIREIAFCVLLSANSKTCEFHIPVSVTKGLLNFFFLAHSSSRITYRPSSLARATINNCGRNEFPESIFSDCCSELKSWHLRILVVCFLSRHCSQRIKYIGSGIIFYFCNIDFIFYYFDLSLN